MKDDEYEDAFNSIKNSDALYPIVPQFDEKHELFIIVSENEIDANNLRERLNMQKMKSYKSERVSRSNVIHIKDVLSVL